MKRVLQTLTKTEYDLIIVGAGIFGVCAAWDAAQRGLRVAIVEKYDFCQGTSANHYKFVHGGIRYLQHADLSRVRESCRERAVLLRIAPHLIQPIPIMIPTYGYGTRGLAFMRAGFSLYDMLTLDRNREIKDPERRIPDGDFLRKEEVLRHFPDLDTGGLTGAAILHEAQYFNSPRLAISFLRSAVEAGAAAANYLEVTDLLRRGENVVGVKVKDCLKGECFDIRGKLVLLTCGPWSHRLFEKSVGKSLKPKPTYSRDLAFVVSRKMSDKYALACPVPSGDQDAIIDRGSRHVFLTPWRDHTLIGVWHKVFDAPPEALYVKPQELQSYIDEVNRGYPALNLSLDDITWVNTGLTLFGDKEKQGENKMSFAKRSRLVDHQETDKIEGLLTLIGVRATTARGMAEKTINLVLKKLGRKTQDSLTACTAVWGGEIEYFKPFLTEALEKRPTSVNEKTMTAFVKNYGSEYPSVLKYGDEMGTSHGTIGETTCLKAEVKYAIEEEMAQNLGDIVFRRTDLGTCGSPGDAALKKCADLAGDGFGWTADQLGAELKEVKTLFDKKGFIRQ